jgi:hypothetical protein
MTLGVPAVSARGRGAARLRRRRRIAALAAMTVASLALAVSCSGDDDSDSATPDDPTTSPRPTTTAPRAEDADELRDEIQTLLTSYDEVLRQIVADPRVASNREDPLYDELRTLMTPDNSTIDPVINALVAAGGRGERQVPEDGSNLPIERRIEGGVEVVGENRFKVLVCTHLNYRVFDNQDDPIAVVRDYVEPSNVLIVRIDDQLRIEQFETLDERLCGEGNR